jgi:hypothetical protein
MVSTVEKEVQAMIQARRRGSKASGLGVLLVFAVMLTMLSPHAAWAGFRGCRGDPIVWLSNGDKLVMGVTIEADATDVVAVSYTIHAPEGTSIDRIVETGGALKEKEFVELVADQPAGHYTVDTVVTTTSADVPVTAFVRIRGELVTRDGLSGEHLLFTFTSDEAIAAP